ncbi:hypothetical protein IIC68_01180 [archaeon]|nr:hypothetical protein [archaeon]
MSQSPFINDSGTLLVFGVIGFIGVIIFGIIGYFLDQFGVYLMYKKNIGSFTALREGISLGLGNFVELLVLIIIQIVLGIVIGIIVFVIGLIFVIPVIIIGLLFAGLAILALQNIILLFILGVFGVIFLLLVMYATTFALTPVYVFIFRYNMNVLEGFLNKR